MAIERNLIANAGGDAISVVNARGAIVRNNVLFGMHGAGVVLGSGSIANNQAVQISNNTMYTAAGGSSIVVASADNTYIRNNILYTNALTFYQGLNVTGTDSGFNITKAATSKNAAWPIEMNDLSIANAATVQCGHKAVRGTLAPTNLSSSEKREAFLCEWYCMGSYL
jgi:hypothetical protein